MSEITGTTSSTRQGHPAVGTKRRRAARACLSCRSRKVRCDVSRSGPPCMNCSLDNLACIVKARKPKSSARGRRASSHGESVESPDQFEEPLPETTTQQSENPPTQNTVAVTENLDQLSAFNNHHEGLLEEVSLENTYDHDASFHVDDDAMQAATMPPQPDPVPSGDWLPALVPEPEMDPFEVPSHRRRKANSVMYTYYPFLTLNNLFNCLPQDVEFLETEGCFHLPTPQIMDQILRQYFLHVHPLLPLLNEGDFWEMYYCKRSGGTHKMSLLVLQSIMFVSCNFVNWSLESAQKFGYKNIRSLRATFYRRAKLLHDFGAESSPVAIAQAALLLSHWTPPVRTETKPNTVWLSVAIQNAKDAEAPYHATLPSVGRPAEAKRKNILKRLWWCCVIRDRILPLGLRRGIQITRAHFDFEKHRPLSFMDLDDEIHRSVVYSPEAKRELIRVLSHVLDLCVILTDVLLLVFPLDGAVDKVRERPTLALLEETEIRSNKKALVHWYASAVAAGEGGAEINWNSHDSVILYTHWMYTYYHSARMALYHHELQHYLALMADNKSIETQKILDTRDAIQNAFSNITENLRGLNQRHLTRWLPISAAAYIAFPLALHVLNTRLSAAFTQMPSSNDTLIDVIKAMHVQYDGVDWVARLVRYLVDLVQDDLAFTTAGSSVNDWAELLAVKPRTYLRLSLAMDLSMSSGRFPDKKDFLARLDGLRLGRSARVLRALADPSEGSHVDEERQDDRQAPVEFTSPINVDISSLLPDRLGHEDENDDTSFKDAQGHLGQPQGLSAAESDLDRFASFPTELESFFNPSMGDLDTIIGSSNSEGTYEGDIGTTLVDEAEMMQI